MDLRWHKIEALKKYLKTHDKAKNLLIKKNTTTYLMGTNVTKKKRLLPKKRRKEYFAVGDKRHKNIF